MLQAVHPPVIGLPLVFLKYNQANGIAFPVVLYGFVSSTQVS